MLPRQVQFQTKAKWASFQVSLSYFSIGPIRLLSSKALGLIKPGTPDDVSLLSS